MKKLHFVLPSFQKTVTVVVVGLMLLGLLAVTGIQIVQAAEKVEQLWQCDPPIGYDPATYTCTPAQATGWVTGNNDGIYREGDVVPYRTHMSGLVVGTMYSLNVEWDTTKSSKHAIDYLASYNETIISAAACAGLKSPADAICSTTLDTYPIPADTFMQADANWNGTQIPGVFSMWGGDITSTSPYTPPPNYIGDTSTSITIYFTATMTEMVLAWGGHIADRVDWGVDNSAVSISGSPYHMRLLGYAIWDGTAYDPVSLGNVDRSLSADAVVYPAQITIIKETIPAATGTFTFTATPSPLLNFILPTDGDGGGSYTKTFPDIINFTTYTVVESIPTDWTLYDLSCLYVPGIGGGGFTATLATATASINLKEGDSVTCTFKNKKDVDITVTKSDLDYLRPYPADYLQRGETFVYYIDVTNLDTSATADSVSLTDTLDPNIRFVGPVVIEDPTTLETLAQGRNCTPPTYTLPTDGGGTLTCDLKSILPGDTVSISFPVQVLQSVGVYGLIEVGACTQNPNRQGDALVDVCNLVSVTTTTPETDYTNNSDSEPTDISLPTVVMLKSFTTTPAAKSIILNWETATEKDNLLFNLYRATSLTGKRTKIATVYSIDPGGNTGGVYQYVDKRLTPKKTYYYWLEDVDKFGVKTLHGPISAKPLVK